MPACSPSALPPAPSILRQLPRSFWVANGMEIFERMGWYGFYAVSTLYLTGATAEGGLGLSSRDRGVIQGLTTFFLYFFPSLFGTLADRYGYRRMFLLSGFLMAPAYLLLRWPRSFWGFFAVYLLVAMGHGMFKPVVISTIVRTTDARTGTLGFGIFYMMVNIGGLVGPIIAGVVRGWDWSYVFLASAGWISLMTLLCLLLYQEPPRRQASEPLGEVLWRMVALVGNLRFFLLLIGMLVILVMGSKWWSFPQALRAAALWLGVHLLWDLLLRWGHGRQGPDVPWYRQRLRVGQGRYLLFLLLMSGFWTCFNQLSMTLPEYIRDYCDTGDLSRWLSPAGAAVTELFHRLGVDTSSWSRAVLERGQLKPEHLINLNALGIVLLQVLVSWTARQWQPLTTIITGILITAVSFALHLLGRTGWNVVLCVLVFSIGEMLASPKSKEYAGRIAPPDKVGMYMGYFYLCVALGNLFGGLLSGISYQHFGPRGLNRPDLLWLGIAALAALTAGALGLYDRWVRRTGPGALSHVSSDLSLAPAMGREPAGSRGATGRPPGHPANLAMGKGSGCSG
ncbi:MAG: MFS transporter [Myxococcota bacterium]|nr:MFS transporter [Myxococcota bacterium]